MAPELSALDFSNPLKLSGFTVPTLIKLPEGNAQFITGTIPNGESAE